MNKILGVIKKWQAALSIEIDYLKNQGGSRYLVTDGKLLSKLKNSATYWFILSSDVVLPDGSPIRLKYKNNSYYGTVISTEGFDLVLQLEVYIGDDISEAELYSEPWELLVALKNRLYELQDNSNKLKRVKRLLLPNSLPKHLDYNYKTPLHELVIRAKLNPTTFVWGPPGTGKTYNLSRVIGSRYFKGKKILVLAHSNAAVDVLMYGVTKFVEAKDKWKIGEIVRYGYSRDENVKSHPTLLSSKLVEYFDPDLELKKRSLEEDRITLKKSSINSSSSTRLAQVETELKELRELIKEMEKTYVERAKVIGVTLSKAAMDSLIYSRNFDLVVIDEASMAYVPQVAFAASLGMKIVVCGDFRQLPPIALSDHKLVNHWLKEDIFHHTKIVQQVDRRISHPNLFMLTEQRRMHPSISGFTNHYVYDDRVTDYKSMKKDREYISNLAPFSGLAALLVDISRMGAYCLKESASESRFNVYSALLSIQLVLIAKKYGIDSIGIIAPYKAQSRLVTACLQELIAQETHGGERNVIAATVHKFQGSERDMIIFDSVDSFPQTRAGVLLTDENSDRLVNVAVTRAKGKFIQIADTNYLKSRVTKRRALYKLMDHLGMEHETFSRYELAGILTQTIDKRLQWFDEKNLEKVYEDLKNANKNIVVSIPKSTILSEDTLLALKLIENKVKITVIAKETTQLNIKCDIIPSNSVMPYVMIDDEIFWVGFPIMSRESLGDYTPKPPFLMGRLKSKKIVKMLMTYLDIKAAKYSHDQVNQIVVSYRPNYTLNKFIETWERCPTCRSIVIPETTSKGRKRLICKHCGHQRGVGKSILNRYIQYINMRCRKCNSAIEVKGHNSNSSISCDSCNETVDVNSLW